MFIKEEPKIKIGDFLFFGCVLYFHVVFIISFDVVFIISFYVLTQEDIILPHPYTFYNLIII